MLCTHKESTKEPAWVVFPRLLVTVELRMDGVC